MRCSSLAVAPAPTLNFGRHLQGTRSSDKEGRAIIRNAADNIDSNVQRCVIDALSTVIMAGRHSGHYA